MNPARTAQSFFRTRTSQRGKSRDASAYQTRRFTLMGKEESELILDGFLTWRILPYYPQPGNSSSSLGIQVAFGQLLLERRIMQIYIVKEVNLSVLLRDGGLVDDQYRNR
jgi:hypothetical protein